MSGKGTREGQAACSPPAGQDYYSPPPPWGAEPAFITLPDLWFSVEEIEFNMYTGLDILFPAVKNKNHENIDI